MRNKSPWFKTPSAGQCCPNTFIICVHMDCFHKVSPSSYSSLNEDVEGLSPKHYKSLKKLPEIH